MFVNLFNGQRGYVQVEGIMRLRPKVKVEALGSDLNFQQFLDLFYSADGVHKEFDHARSTALPARLLGAVSEEPLYLDPKWVKTETDVSMHHRPGSLHRCAVTPACSRSAG